MRKFLVFVALCAVCTAAPAPIEVKDDEVTARPSPINPDVITDPKPADNDKIVLLDEETHHRQKRDEPVTPAPAKPQFAEARELIHDPQLAKLQASVVARESLQHDPKKLKRELNEQPVGVAAHETLQHDGHTLDHAKPDSVQAHDALQHDKPDTAQAHHGLQHENPKPKRDLTEKPAEVAVHEPFDHDAPAHAPAPAHEHDQSKPQSVPAHEELHHELPKQKRETLSAPVRKDAEKSESAVVVPEVLVAHSEHIDHQKVSEAVQRHQRDIPVPTQIKTTAAPKEEKPSHESSENLSSSSTTPHTPHSPLRHHPVPVAELFNKPKSTSKPSSDSSEENKESKESKESQ